MRAQLADIEDAMHVRFVVHTLEGLADLVEHGDTLTRASVPLASELVEDLGPEAGVAAKEVELGATDERRERSESATASPRGTSVSS